LLSNGAICADRYVPERSQDFVEQKKAAQEVIDNMWNMLRVDKVGLYKLMGLYKLNSVDP
jgi:hypothetical protein